MKQTKLLIGAVLLATASLAGVASAATITSSTPIELEFDLGDASGIYGKTFSRSVSGNSFADEFTFTLDRASDFSFSFSSTKTSTKDLTFSSLGLFGSSGLLLNAPISTNGVGGESSDNNRLILAAGNYSIKVAGNVAGTAGGSYSGTVNISPVPEADTWAMMALGLAGVGAIARRKAKKSA